MAYNPADYTQYLDLASSMAGQPTPSAPQGVPPELAAMWIQQRAANVRAFLIGRPLPYPDIGTGPNPSEHAATQLDQAAQKLLVGSSMAGGNGTSVLTVPPLTTPSVVDFKKLTPSQAPGTNATDANAGKIGTPAATALPLKQGQVVIGETPLNFEQLGQNQGQGSTVGSMLPQLAGTSLAGRPAWRNSYGNVISAGAAGGHPANPLFDLINAIRGGGDARAAADTYIQGVMQRAQANAANQANAIPAGMWGKGPNGEWITQQQMQDYIGQGYRLNLDNTWSAPGSFTEPAPVNTELAKVPWRAPASVGTDTSMPHGSPAAGTSGGISSPAPTPIPIGTGGPGVGGGQTGPLSGGGGVLGSTAAGVAFPPTESFTQTMNSPSGQSILNRIRSSYSTGW